MPYGFRPWIGNNYQQSRWGKRVLVLGESHYQWDANVPINNYLTLTIECVEGQIAGDPAVRDRPQQFWTGIAIAFLNPPPGCRPTVAEKEEFWHSVAFYNYIQQSVGFGPKPNPTPPMWCQSLPAFQHLLDTLQPELVVVLGRPNWWNIQRLGSAGPPINGARYTETQWLRHAGGSCLAYGIKHPSGGFNGQYWHPFIMRALALA